MHNTLQVAKKVRQSVLKMISKSGASHIASALSMVDILVVLYGKVMNISPDNLTSKKRDFFVLSKGHGASAMYATLHEYGFISDEIIENYYLNGSLLSGHVSHKGVLGIEVSTGSLGHGACIAAGIALAEKLNDTKNKTFVIVGDGECNEGCIWEMALFAAQHKLSNFTVIVDCNKMQAMGLTSKILNMDNMQKMWEAFGFATQSIDGHDHQAIEAALRDVGDKPRCIIANTIKGKGVSFMENNILWHYRDPQGECYEKALKELTKE